MALLSLIVALLLEQVRPVNPHGAAFQAFRRWTDMIADSLNAGERRHGALGWACAVLPWVVAVNLVFWILHGISPVFAWAWDAAVLYFTMGFRQFSHGFTVVLEAMRAGQIDRARTALGQWREDRVDEYTQTEVAKVSIEQGLLGSHRHVFGVIAWFVVLPAVCSMMFPGALAVLLSGPAGAVLYRLSALLGENWGVRDDEEFEQFGGFAREAFHVLDWVPARLTAASFAVVGDFEDAVYCWRSQAASWLDPLDGIVLASGAGAVGVRLGETLHADGSVIFRPEIGLDDEADVEHMQRAVGLIWRALIMWVMVIGLITIASWIGS